MSNIKITSNKPIAMVDDNIVDYEAANRFIKKSKLNNEIIHFLSGDEFIEHLKNNIQRATEITPALVLMDINMPGLNGHQTTKAIRKLPEYKDIPIIYMFTSSSDYKDKAEDAGANGFIIKPFSPEEYIDLFNSFI